MYRRDDLRGRAFLAMSSSSCPALGPKLVPSVTELNLSSTAPWQPHVHDRGDGRRSSVHPFMYWPRDLDSHEGLQALRDTILAQQFPRDPSACNSTSTRCSNPAPVPACYAYIMILGCCLHSEALDSPGWLSRLAAGHSRPPVNRDAALLRQ